MKNLEVLSEDNNILYISYDGMTDPLGSSQVLPYLLGLENAGYKIDLISFEKKEAFIKRKDIIFDSIKNKSINWHYIDYTSKPPVLSTFKDIHKLTKKAKLLLNQKNFKIIHARSYIAAFVALKLKKKFGIPFIFDMRGFWADERIEGGIWSKKNPVYLLLYKYLKNIEKKYISKSDYTVSLTEKGVEVIKSWQLKENINFKVIPCCADMNLFNYNNYTAKDRENIRNKINVSKEDVVLSYLGSIGTWYMLDEMLDFFAELKKHKDNTKFLFITNEDKNSISKRVSFKGLNHDDIRIYKSERNDVPLYLLASDINIFFIKQSFSKQASSPTKLAEALGMGLPVITNTGVGDIDKIITTNNIGLTINSFDITEYDKVIMNLDSLLKIDKKNLFNISEKLFGLESGISKYCSIYKEIIRSTK